MIMTCIILQIPLYILIYYYYMTTDRLNVKKTENRCVYFPFYFTLGESKK